MSDILERAARGGLETEYRDAFGHLRSVDTEVLARLLDSLAVEGQEPARLLPRTVVVRGKADRVVRLAVPEGLPLRWEIYSQEKLAGGEGLSPVLNLPGTLPNGVFRLHVTVATPAAPSSDAACLIVCPQCAFQGGEKLAAENVGARGAALRGQVARQLGSRRFYRPARPDRPCRRFGRGGHRAQPAPCFVRGPGGRGESVFSQ